MAAQSFQELITAWEASNRFPCPKNGNALLLQTEHNFRVLGDALRAKPPQSVNDIVLIVNELTHQNKLQYDIPKVVEKEVIKEVVREVPAVKSAKQLAREAREKADLLGIKNYEHQTTDYDRYSKKNPEAERPIESVAFDAAQQLSAEAALDRMITNHAVAGPSGRVNHSETHKQREALRAIRYITASGSADFVRMAQEASSLIRKWDKERERANSHHDGW